MISSLNLKTSLALGLSLVLLFGVALSIAEAKNNKVTICHLTSSESNPVVEITISEKAAAKHLANHGDFLLEADRTCADGPVGDDDPGDDDGGGDDGPDGPPPGDGPPGFPQV